MSTRSYVISSIIKELMEIPYDYYKYRKWIREDKNKLFRSLALIRCLKDFSVSSFERRVFIIYFYNFSRQNWMVFKLDDAGQKLSDAISEHFGTAKQKYRSNFRVVGPNSEPPTEKEIKEYYKKYVENFRSEMEWEWSTDKEIPFEEYEERARAEGWTFLMESISTFTSFDLSSGVVTHFS